MSTTARISPVTGAAPRRASATSSKAVPGALRAGDWNVKAFSLVRGVGSTRSMVTGASVKRAKVAAMAGRSMNCLIVNTKGGGHAFIGLYLARELILQGHKVTILNDGDQGKLSGKAPFAKYSLLEEAGAQIIWGSPTDASRFPGGNFDVVYDNNGKDLDTCKPLIDAYASKVQHYVFVSSAGMYKVDPGEPMSIEGDKRAEKGHYFVEEYLKQVNAPYTIFRPLYIYGPDSAKDYHQWMMDRILRDRPVCIPGSGMQCTSMTHVMDVASMLASVLGNPNAVRQDFNVCSDRTITFNGMAKAIAAAAGKEAKIVYYDPEELGLGKGSKAEGFPFRTVHFFASADKAKRILRWRPRHDFMSDVPALLKMYVEEGRMNKSPDFSIDDKVLSASKQYA